ncbi:MAG: thermonuclease family protein [Chloroflexi bacterium]|nr:thermonuclease family protein [Chloroflexota bacterium]
MKTMYIYPLLVFLVSACNAVPTATPNVLAPSTSTETPQPPTETSIPLTPTKTSPPTPTLPINPLLDCIPADGIRTSAIVTGVVDGDTIDISIRGLTFRVRYLGIDTPETRNPNTGIEAGGPEASSRNRELVSGQHVTLVNAPNDADKDPYGRWLRYVIVGDIFVNYQLVREGLANLYISGLRCGSLFFDAWEAANAENIGLHASASMPED